MTKFCLLRQFWTKYLEQSEEIQLNLLGLEFLSRLVTREASRILSLLNYITTFVLLVANWKCTKTI